MRWVVAFLAAALALSIGHHDAWAQTKVVATCGGTIGYAQIGSQNLPTMDPNGNTCVSVVGTFSGTVNSAINATSTLPTLITGNQTPQGSLAGAAYVQPVFGSASGGGTQVDATHGLPVNVIAGGGGGSSGIADESAFTQGTTVAQPIGGFYTTSVVNLTSGQFGALRLTLDRNAMVDVEKFGGNAIVTGGAGGLLAVGGPVASGGANVDNPEKIGAVFNTTQPTVATGQVVDLQSTARGALLVATGADTFSVTVNASLPGGGNTIGAVSQAGAPWTDNISQWNGVQVDTNSGNKSNGTLRVVLATDQPNFTTPLNVTGTGGTLATAGNQANVQVAVAGATAPTNANVAACVFNTSFPALTTGQGVGLQCDSSGRLVISPTNLSVAIASATAGQTGSLILGAVTTSAPSYTSGQSDPLSLDTAGNLRMNCVVGCSSSTFADAAAFTQGSTPVGVIAGLYSTSITNLTSGQAGAVQLTTDRMMYANLGKVGGTAVDTNTGNATAGTIRVALATNQPNLTTPLNTSPVTAGGCAGQSVANTFVKSFSIASTTAQQLVALVSAKQVYICAIDIVVGAITNVALIEGTQTTNPCDTATAGMAGGTTAGTGWNFAANSGLTKGDGQGIVFRTATAGHQVCLLAGVANQISGSITYAQF